MDLLLRGKRSHCLSLYKQRERRPINQPPRRLCDLSSPFLRLKNASHLPLNMTTRAHACAIYAKLYFEIHIVTTLPHSFFLVLMSIIRTTCHIPVRPKTTQMQLLRRVELRDRVVGRRPWTSLANAPWKMKRDQPAPSIIQSGLSRDD
jgi:hypothetical protein